MYQGFEIQLIVRLQLERLFQAGQGFFMIAGSEEPSFRLAGPLRRASTNEFAGVAAIERTRYWPVKGVSMF